ncbi:hypothetical protein [Microbacterium lacticum]
MSEVKGHAAFHKHKDAPRYTGTKAGTRPERRALLKESMRNLDPREGARQARMNSNIVPADAHLNTAYVNDGNGGFTVATDIKQVLDYGDAREKKTRYLRAGMRTVDLFAIFLPKTMCIEIKDYYPRHNPDGSERLDPETGEPMSRSRWVARDHDEAMRYFVSVVAFLGLKVSPGGMDSIHGWATNFDESTPHIQVMADPFAPDPKAPGMLRPEASRAYSSHRDVVCPEGTISIHRDKDTRTYRRLGDPMGFAFTPDERVQLEQLTGKPYDQIDLADMKGLDGKKLGGGIVRYAEGKPAWGEYKMQAAQGALRERMVAEGYPVEYEPGENHGRELPKEVYEEVQDEKAEAAALRDAGHEAMVGAAETATVAEAEYRADAARAHEDLDSEEAAMRSEVARERRQLKTQLAAAREEITTGRAEVKAERADLPRMRQVAKDEGYADGLKDAQADVPMVLADARAEADAIRLDGQIAARRLREDAEREAADIKAGARPAAIAEARAEIVPERDAALELARRVHADNEAILGAVEIFVPKEGQKRDYFNDLVERNKRNKIAARNSQADLAKHSASTQRQTPAQKYGLGD